MKKIVSKEIRIGMAFILGLFLLFFGIKFLKGFNIFKPSNSYLVTFQDVSGLSVSSPVLLNGYKVGQVSGMRVDPQNMKKVLVELTMDKDIQIRKGSRLNLDVSMLGSASLVLNMNPYTKDIATSKDTLIGQNVVGLMETFQKQMAPQVINMLPKIDSILMGVQALVNNPALAASLENVNETTKNINLATQALQQMMAQLNHQVPTITNNLATTSGNFSQMSARMNKLDFERTFSRMDSTMSNVQRMSQKLNSRDNSLGLLLNERALYDSLNIAVGHTSALLEDLKKNPKKYINLKVF